MSAELKEDVKQEVELKTINTNLFDDKRAELISLGLLPSFLDPDILNEESEVGKLVKTELTSMGLLPVETDCSSIEKVNSDKIKKFKCDKCDATFTSSNGKKYHINKVHTTEKDSIEKPYKCLEDGCFKKFTSKNGLKSHKKIKHPVKNTL
ncbi:zinc finger protein [Nosema bombycis CQ1]|uniref:Zinc finger protein n=1 Tax=Nosema bombycis (strain CQ1 / CVCC 102059) TaxID=578461 RepID=R0KMT8_NOSB1|nr:zinc finger protein [Nosema bombycis CQ1]|eukprot:EOB11437.1 zinc finger protein [Nosema bombycis CQ1]